MLGAMVGSGWQHEPHEYGLLRLAGITSTTKARLSIACCKDEYMVTNTTGVFCRKITRHLQRRGSWTGCGGGIS
jgi:hypothetical protein